MHSYVNQGIYGGRHQHFTITQAILSQLQNADVKDTTACSQKEISGKYRTAHKQNAGILVLEIQVETTSC